MAVALAEPLFLQAAPRSTARKVFLPVLLSFFVGLGCALFWKGCGWQLASTQELAINAAGVRPLQPLARAYPVQAKQLPMLPVQPARMQSRFAFTPNVGEMGKAESAITAPLNRRDLLGALLVAGPLLSGPAQALIADDDDADLVEKAKAKRKSKLQEEKKAERAYVESAGFTGDLQLEVKPVQIAIKQLAIAGTALKSDDVKTAAQEVTDEWIGPFKKAVEKVSTTEESKKLSKPLFDAVRKFKDAVKGSKIKEGKAAFVETVEDLKAWAAEAQVATLLQGI